jgi:Fe-S-cluster formation regulator IscX/YfhJ
MTWFEVEQIARFVSDLESALDDWKLNNVQMREKLAELERVNARLQNVARARGLSAAPVLLQAIRDLDEQIRLCDRSIRERLISN